VKAREHVAEWVREIGVNDPELSPNHAWRHSFKVIGSRNGLTEKVIDAIVGHRPASVGRGYGPPTLAQTRNGTLGRVLRVFKMRTTLGLSTS
jgi:hypothetical protein